MKVYLYTYAYDKIKTEGYKSLSLFSQDSEHFQNCLMTHRHSAKSDNPAEIVTYLEQTFTGRLRSICVVTETAPVADYKHPYLNYLVHHADIISFDLERLITDGIVEAVYCKDTRKTILTAPDFENIYRITNLTELDLSPCDWHLCEDSRYSSFSPWATIKHYFLVLKKGYIPPEYITLEKDNTKSRLADNSKP